MGGDIDDAVGISADFMVDLSKCLSGWPVTGKRGRKGAVSTEFRPGLDKRIQEGVANLTRKILGRRVDDPGNQDFDNHVMLSNNQMETGISAGRKVNGAGIKRHDSVRMVQDKSRIESIEIDASGDDNGGRIVKQTEAKCTYCDRTFKSFQALGGHKRVHQYKPKEKREMMEESEGENDADITGWKMEVARMEWTSDKHNKKDGRILGSDDINNELDVNKSPNFLSGRQNGAKRAPDATTAGNGKKKQERRKFDLNRSPNSPT